jgi:hypothetical protein
MPHDDPRESLPRPTPFDDHPSARAVRARPAPPPKRVLTHAEVRAIALEAGRGRRGGGVARSSGSVRGAALRAERRCRGPGRWSPSWATHAPDDVRSPGGAWRTSSSTAPATRSTRSRSASSVALSLRGHRSINPAMAFPMEMDAFPGRSWIVSHKKVAVAAQLGRMGIHRSVIHPTFGSFILLGDRAHLGGDRGCAGAARVRSLSGLQALRRGVPGGSDRADGFRFSACYDHNYREFMTGFADFAEEIADSRDPLRAPRSGVAVGDRLALAEPRVQAQLQGGLLPRRVPRGRGRAGALPRQASGAPQGRGEAAHRAGGDDLRGRRLGRGGPRAQALPHKRVRVVRSSLRPDGYPSASSARSP